MIHVGRQTDGLVGSSMPDSIPRRAARSSCQPRLDLVR
jgi:hypothetical protein